MRIHISSAKTRVERKDGDQKMIKGVLHERISTQVLYREYDSEKGEIVYGLAYNCTGGRQNHEWVPVTDLVGESPWKRRYYPEIDGERK